MITPLTLPRLDRLSIRKRLGLGVAVLVLPLLLVTFSGYLLFHYALEMMDEIYEEVSDQFVPVTTLQEKLLRSVMPPNDYLIHGNLEERQQFQMLRREVDEGFKIVLALTFSDPQNRASIVNAQMLWLDAVKLSDEILAMEKPLGSAAGAHRMEILDGLVDQIYIQLKYATASTVSDLRSRHHLIHQMRLKISMVIIVFIIMISVVALIGSLLIRRWVITPLAELETGAQQLAEGQLDFRLSVHSDDEIGRVARTFNDMAAALKHDREILRNLSIHDTLTGLLNRKELERLLDIELTRALRHGHKVALLMIDVDHFKKVNDNYGHPAGDVVLKNVAHRLGNSLRPSDLIARYGGEEFIIMLPHTDSNGAAAFGERLCAYLRSTPVDVSATIQPVITVSVGIAIFPSDGENIASLTEAADQAMYAAKSAGRNRCCLYAEISL
jgi:diguanylate cyclase (GGDEF)-like protein